MSILFGDGSRANFHHYRRVLGLFGRQRFFYIVLIVFFFFYGGYESLDGYHGGFILGCCDRVDAIGRFGGEAGPAVVTIG